MRLITFACAVAFALSLANPVACGDPCGSFRDTRGRSSVDVAPLPGFVDVCSRDFQLCVMLTQGYPRSVQTIAYFVPTEQWQLYEKGKHKGFNPYLIAQKGRTLSTEDFAEFKRYVHSQQGNIPDHTKPATIFELHGQASLGIIDETPDSIWIGTLASLSETAFEKRDLLLAAINVAFQIKGETLSLYVYDSIKDASDTDRVKQLTKRWVQCIRKQNSK
jgi:hypothetical protein